MCVMMDGAWSTAARRECNGWHQTRQVWYSEGQYDELWRTSGELEHVNSGKCVELAWCSRAVPGVTESSGCVIGRARQLVNRWACECYRRRGVMYMRQICRADSMRDDMSKICHRYGGVTSYRSDWSQCHGIWVVSCLECLETERSSGTSVYTICECYKACFRWWCGIGCSWQWLGNMGQLSLSGRISRRVRGMM